MLELKDITLRFERKTVLDKCSLALRTGERIALTGPSGCGKTTLLRLALGLQMPDGGSAGCTFQSVAAVFQEPRLLPWRTAAENVNLVLSDKAETMPEALHWLDTLELSDAQALYPSEMSGGMQQRLSIARALASKPQLLVMDEPFKAMDDKLNERVVRTVAASIGEAALLLVTHSEAEARSLGCRILRYENGKFL